MSLKLNRKSSTGTVTMAVSGATSGVIQLDGFSFGGYILPSTFDGTAMTYTVCDTIGGTYVALEDSSGNAISQTVEASKAYTFPPELFAFSFAKMVSGTNQSTTDTVIPYTLKG